MSEPSIESKSPSPLAAEFRQKLTDLAAHINDNNRVMERLIEMCDDYGPRFSGTENLENAIDWIVATMKKDGLDVTTEECKVPNWKRGREECTMIAPRITKLNILGAGHTVATPPEGIEAEVICVRNFEELDEEAKRGNVKGKIVVYNCEFTTYGATVKYRAVGADRASAHGALACMLRSVTPVSLNTPHTGVCRYSGDVPKIPSACLTIEAACMIQRFKDRGIPVRVKLILSGEMHADATSRNVIAEIKGRESPEEVVLISGHVDSWDVGQGAHDDGQAVIACWEALRLLKEAGIQARRTMRVVMWTNEENGHGGAKAYLENHRAELPNTVLALESDTGAGDPQHFGFHGTAEGKQVIEDCIGAMNEVLTKYGCDMKDTNGPEPMGFGIDTRYLCDQGVPGILLQFDSHWMFKGYWHYHHTEADTVDKVDRVLLERNVQVLAAILFLLAEMPERLPGNTAAIGHHEC